MPKTGFRSFPLIFQWKPQQIKIKIKLVRWDPNKKPPGGNLFLLIGGWTHCFTILFSCWFSITTIKNPVFLFWGSFSNRKKGLKMVVGVANHPKRRAYFRLVNFTNFGQTQQCCQLIFYLFDNVFFVKQWGSHWVGSFDYRKSRQRLANVRP